MRFSLQHRQLMSLARLGLVTNLGQQALLFRFQFKLAFAHGLQHDRIGGDMRLR